MTGITTKGNNEQSSESPSTINGQRTLMPDVSKLIDNVYEFANQFFELLRIGETDNNTTSVSTTTAPIIAMNCFNNRKDANQQFEAGPIVIERNKYISFLPYNDNYEACLEFKALSVPKRDWHQIGKLISYLKYKVCTFSSKRAVKFYEV